MPSPAELAAVMFQRFDHESYLDQAEAVDLIADAGGYSFLQTNDHGNMSIMAPVLAEFRKLTDKTAVWMKSALAWRRRDPLTDDADTREQPL